MNDQATSEWSSAFLQRHQLDQSYLDAARTWFDPLVERLATLERGAGQPVLIALNGCQGSGKTTLCDYLCTALRAEHSLGVVSLSLDDFYLTRTERQALATSVHPLLATRGVPGTHDMTLLQHTLEQLLRPSDNEPMTIPRFDKAADDRHPRPTWEIVPKPVQVVLLEGWCLGARRERADSLTNPINSLERSEDPDGSWRGYVNEALAATFEPLYSLVDQWIMLQAPSFDCVFEWRREQERKLAATLPPDQAAQLMDDDALLCFIQHYERLTRRCLSELPSKVNHLFSLDRNRQVFDYQYRANTAESE